MPFTSRLLRRLTVRLTVGACLAAALIGRNLLVPDPATGSGFEVTMMTSSPPAFRANAAWTQQ